MLLDLQTGISRWHLARYKLLRKGYRREPSRNASGSLTSTGRCCWTCRPASRGGTWRDTNCCEKAIVGNPLAMLPGASHRRADAAGPADRHLAVAPGEIQTAAKRLS